MGSEGVGDIARSVDREDFTLLVQRHQHELTAHCYRMLASVEDAQDLVQETFVRAWDKRESIREASAVRAWLYRIATNACLDFLRRRPERSTAPDRAPDGAVPLAVSVRWLQPAPEDLAAHAQAREATPDEVVIEREALELAFLVALQHLPPRQRAVHILKDVQGWSAQGVADHLEMTVAGVNSALQRARESLRRHLPPNRSNWAASAASEVERDLLQRYVAATEASDITALTALLHDDARCGQQPGASGHQGPNPSYYAGRDVIRSAWAPALEGADAAVLRLIPTRANGQPAAGVYLWDYDSDQWQAFGLDVLHVRDGLIDEINAFVPEMLPPFGLPLILPAPGDGGSRGTAQ